MIFLGLDWLLESGRCVNADETCAHNGKAACKEPASYLGSKSSTKTGKTCQNWNETSPHNPNYGTQYGSTNVCRNPAGDEVHRRVIP